MHLSFLSGSYNRKNKQRKTKKGEKKNYEYKCIREEIIEKKGSFLLLKCLKKTMNLLLQINL